MWNPSELELTAQLSVVGGIYLVLQFVKIWANHVENYGVLYLTRVGTASCEVAVFVGLSTRYPELWPLIVFAPFPFLLGVTSIQKLVQLYRAVRETNRRLEALKGQVKNNASK